MLEASARPTSAQPVRQDASQPPARATSAGLNERSNLTDDLLPRKPPRVPPRPLGLVQRQVRRLVQLVLRRPVDREQRHADAGAGAHLAALVQDRPPAGPL